VEEKIPSSLFLVLGLAALPHFQTKNQNLFAIFVILAVNPLHLPLCITKPARGAALQYL
jgi:hypothetical protein